MKLIRFIIACVYVKLKLHLTTFFSKRLIVKKFDRST
jgi:hypothetical protein